MWLREFRARTHAPNRAAPLVRECYSLNRFSRALTTIWHSMTSCFWSRGLAGLGRGGFLCVLFHPHAQRFGPHVRPHFADVVETGLFVARDAGVGPAARNLHAIQPQGIL